MALSPTPNFYQTVANMAGAGVAGKVASKFSPRQIGAISKFAGVSSILSETFGLSTDPAHPLLGGITMQDAKLIMQTMRAQELARANLWFIEMEDLNPPSLPSRDTGVSSVQKDGNSLFSSVLSITRTDPFSALGNTVRGAIQNAIPGAAQSQAGPTETTTPMLFNLFAQTVSYSPSTITSEKTNIGSTVMDGMSGTECVDMTITTLDDKYGTLKKWFDAKCGQAAHGDGTYGVPFEYLIKVTVHHMTVEAAAWSYHNTYLMRPTAIQHDLDRGAQDLEKLHMTFSQFDTFVS